MKKTFQTGTQLVLALTMILTARTANAGGVDGAGPPRIPGER